MWPNNKQDWHFLYIVKQNIINNYKRFTGQISFQYLDFWAIFISNHNYMLQQIFKYFCAHSIYMVSISEKSESDSDRFEPKILKLRGVTTIILPGCATWSDQNYRFYNQKTKYFHKFLKKMANLAAAEIENPKSRLGILKVISKGTNCLNFRP